MNLKIEISQFLSKVNPNNGNERESHIFLWDIFESGVISFKRIKIFK